MVPSHTDRARRAPALPSRSVQIASGVAVLALVGLGSPAGAQRVTTNPSNLPINAATSVGGAGSNAAYRVVGQTFRTPSAGGDLTALTFWLLRNNPVPPFTPGPGYTLSVRAWANGAPVGPELFSSGLLPSDALPPAGPPQAVTTSVGRLALPGDALFVALITPGAASTPTEFLNVGDMNADTYPDGGTWLETSDGQRVTRPFDLAMVADFAAPQSVVPEPATAALLAPGLIVLAGAAVRRRRASRRAADAGT